MIPCEASFQDIRYRIKQNIGPQVVNEILRKQSCCPEPSRIMPIKCRELSIYEVKCFDEHNTIITLCFEGGYGSNTPFRPGSIYTNILHLFYLLQMF